jgi:uncharacterized protein (DUF1330 family)
MARGYWIAHIDITDPQRYDAYRAANAEAFHKYGARYLIRAGGFECMEGESRSRHVVVEFKDQATALACYRSDEFQRAITFRRGAAKVDLLVIDGYDGPQPPIALEAVAETAAKGYWIGHVDVTEPEGYKAYMVANMAPIGRYGGRFLVRGGAFETMDGSVRSRSVLLAFPSYEAALACHRSPEYQAAAALRKDRAHIDLVACEGYDGLQP